MPYRPTERTEQRREETREAIVAAALDQVAEGGYRSASIQAIAERAGVATGSVYRHFDSKAELFKEVFRRAAPRELDVVDAVSSAGDRPAAERIAAAVEAFARRALAGPVLAYAQIAEPVDPAVEAERLTLRRGYRDVFARALEEGVTAGELPPHDTQIYAAALVGALGEALVGPLSPSSTANGGPGVDVREAGLRGGRRHHEALVATLVQFCLDAIPKEVTRARSRTAA